MITETAAGAMKTALCTKQVKFDKKYKTSLLATLVSEQNNPSCLWGVEQVVQEASILMLTLQIVGSNCNATQFMVTSGIGNSIVQLDSR